MNAITDPVVRKFFNENSFDKRKVVANNMLMKYPDRVPIIIGRGDVIKTPPIKIYKFLAPCDITFGRFITEIRKNISTVDSSVALFFFLQGTTLPMNSVCMKDIYDKYKDDDNFLYIIYSSENTFG